jgi:hypothetical protein
MNIVTERFGHGNDKAAAPSGQDYEMVTNGRGPKENANSGRGRGRNISHRSSGEGTKKREDGLAGAPISPGQLKKIEFC